jgi:nitroimidazol reductase NimA-like FMN-containing flavoprotein (pyridoxamine 5'-phosphate oxidase superfamily)
MVKLIDQRTGMEHLDRDECLRRLARHQHGIGRLAVIEGGRPTIIPVNYALVEDHVVFRSSPGSKLDAALGAGGAAFEIDDVDEAGRTGWSVVVRGRLEVVTNRHQLMLLAATQLAPYVPTTKEHWIMLHPSTITGRMIPTVYGFSL